MALTCLSGVSSVSFDLWHRGLGHLSGLLMEKLKGMTDDLSFGEVSKEPCEGCCKGKACIKKFLLRKNGKRAKDLLALMHCDLADPMEMDFLGGNRYYLMIKRTRKVFGYLFKTKNEVFAKFKKIKPL